MQIYIAEGTQQTGPFDLETIKAGLGTGRYQPTQLAWYEGAPGWEPISKLPGMEVAVAPPPPPPAPPVPPYSPAPPPYSPAPLPYSSAPSPYSPAPPAYSPGATPPASYAPPPPSFVPVQSAPYVPGSSAPPKKSIGATIGGILLGGLAVLFGLARITRVFLPHDSSYSSSHTYSSTPQPTTSPGFSASSSSSSPASGTRRFASDRSKYSGDLSTHYVAFSFDYPEGWTLEENTRGCYVVVRHAMRLKSGKSVTAETFALSYAYNKPGYPLSTTLDIAGPQLLEMITAPTMKDSPQATKSAAKNGHFGKYASEDQFITDHVDGGGAGLYTRCSVVPQQNDSTDGLSVTMFSSDLAGSRSAESLGDNGGLRTIRDSFRFGP